MSLNRFPGLVCESRVLPVTVLLSTNWNFNLQRRAKKSRSSEPESLKLKDLELIELNEAFASQSVAILNGLDLDPNIVNVNGGAIALGHPLGCTGGKLTVQLLNEMKRRNKKYGAVTMCVGTGQGACGIFELLN